MVLGGLGAPHNTVVRKLLAFVIEEGGLWKMVQEFGFKLPVLVFRLHKISSEDIVPYSTHNSTYVCYFNTTMRFSTALHTHHLT